MAVPVHNMMRMSHDGLHRIRMYTSPRQPSPAGVPQRVKVEDLAFVVRVGQKVTGIALGVLARIAFDFFEPQLAGCGQISPKRLQLAEVFHPHF